MSYNDLVLLELFDTIQTYDYDKNIRALHQCFIDILVKFDNEEYQNDSKEYGLINKIINILKKAGIDGLMFKYNEESKYISFDKRGENTNILKYILLESFVDNDEFDSLHVKAYINYQNKNYEDAYVQYEELLKLAKSQQDYTSELLALFSKNVILRLLKGEIYKDEYKKYRDIKEADLEKHFLSLPKNIRDSVRVIYKLIKFDYIYQALYRNHEEINKVNKNSRLIEMGGRYFSNESSSKFALIHKNFIKFITFNLIPIDQYLEFKNLNYTFIDVALKKQYLKSQIMLNEYEIFACIKYIAYKELPVVLKDFYEDKGNRKELIIDEEIQKTLIDTILPYFIQNIKNSDKGNDDYFCNVLLLLSLVQVDVDAVVEKIINVVSNAKNSLQIYEAINLFLAIQYNLFERSSSNELLLKFINTTINNYIYNKFSFDDYFAMTRRSVSNLYGVAQAKKITYDDEVTLNKLINVLKDKEVSEQVEVAKSLLLDIYDIGSDIVKANIKSALMEINFKDLKDDHDQIIFELVLINYEFSKVTKRLLNKINGYIEQFADNAFSSAFYNIKSLLENITEKDLGKVPLQEIDNIKIELKKRIELHENWRNRLQTS